MKAVHITIAAILIVSMIGAGYALSYGSYLESTDNRVQYTGTEINILNASDDSQLNSPIGIPAPLIDVDQVNKTLTVTASTHTVNQYKLVVVGTGEIRCWLILNDPLTWITISDASITINGSTQPFIADTTANHRDSSIPVYFDLAAGTYNISFTITYRALSMSLSNSELSAASNIDDLADSVLMFALASDDPAPISNS